MGLVSFGRRHRRPSAKLLKLARKYHVKVSTRKGGKRVYKSVAVLKKQIRAKMNSVHRVHRGRAHVKASGACGGMRKRVCQSNPNCKYIRGTGCRVRGGKLREGPALPPGYNVTSFGRYIGRQFFNDCVPTQISPEWDAPIDPNGVNNQVGWPFYECKGSDFGAPRRVHRRRPARRGPARRRPVRRYSKKGGVCSGLRKQVCHSNPNCTYVMRRGCRARRGTMQGVKYEGPSLPSDYRSSRFGIKKDQDKIDKLVDEMPEWVSWLNDFANTVNIQKFEIMYNDLKKLKDTYGLNQPDVDKALDSAEKAIELAKNKLGIK